MNTIFLAIATFFGPIISAGIAIYYTRRSDAKKFRVDRRSQVFRDLMKTRSLQLHPDHVMSLNLIPCDFHDESDVMDKFRAYIEFLYRKFPTEPAESQRFTEERDLRFGQLMESIAKSLKVKFDVPETKFLRYTPQAWASVEIEQQQIRKLLLGVLRGLTPIHIAPAVQQSSAAQSRPTGLFPEPPIT